MAVFTTTKTYQTRAHMGMIDITEDFQQAVTTACHEKGISSGTITGFTTGGVAGLTTLEFEPGMVHHDLKGAVQMDCSFAFLLIFVTTQTDAFQNVTISKKE